MALVGLLCSQIITILCLAWTVARVMRLSRLVSRATQRQKAPETWELKLRELADEVVSLSSSYEKAQRLLMRLNSREGMRDIRTRESRTTSPPAGASKAELRKFYGLQGQGTEFARQQLSLVPKE